MVHWPPPCAGLLVVGFVTVALAWQGVGGTTAAGPPQGVSVAGAAGLR